MSKEYWNTKGEGYKENWIGKPDQKISEKEMSFVVDYLQKTKATNILDIGCGAGRILSTLSKESTPNARIFGIDYAKNMVETCQKKFLKEPKNSKIQALRVCDISEENIPFDELFDYVTSIRVLKYNKNWKEIIGKVHSSLNSGGRFVFTMPNKYSVSRFSNYGVPIALTSIAEVRKCLEEQGFVLEDAVTFSRIPRNCFLWFSNSRIYANILIFLESLFSRIFGKHLFGKIIFFVAKKV